MQTNFTKIGLATAVILGMMTLTSCDKYLKETDDKIETTLERVEEKRLRAHIPDLPEPTDTVRHKNDIWLGTSSVKIMEGDALPGWLEKDDSVTISIAEETTLPVLAQEITDITGITIRLDDLKAEDAVPTETVPVNYAGKLSGLLNYISNRYSVWWRYKGGIITFFTKETRVFTIYALPTETQLSASLSGTTMGANGADGSASSSLSTSADLKLWDSIEQGIEQVVGEDGKISFSRTTGTVTVTASPFIMRKVAAYVANWNEKLTRQVAISLKVLQVTVSREDNYGFDLRTVFNSKDISGTFTSPYYIDSAGGSGAASAVGLMSMTLINPNSKWKYTAAVIQAFSTLGKTALVTSSSVTTMNNKVAPVQITTSENYVKETNVTTSGSGSDKSVDVDMETDTLNYGFSMEILPRILDHGRLIVLFSLTISDLISLEQFSSNSGSQNGSGEDEEDSEENEYTGDRDTTIVQLPKMQMRGFMQEIAMRSGSTLVLTGFEKVQDMTKSSGIGKPKLSLLGGQAYNNNERDVLVILLTPEVLESPMSPETRMRDF
ncbi:MAG: hypothetical protein ACI4QM_02005 [Alphaproteobacteria bacterium]